MQKYGYVRVSTREQNEARQLDALVFYEILDLGAPSGFHRR